MTNTSIISTSPSGHDIGPIEYVVSTDSRTGYHTTICRLGDNFTSGKREIASIRKRDLLPDTITFGAGKPAPLKRWFEGGTEPFVKGVVQTDFGKLVWKEGDPNCPIPGLVLFCEDDPLTPLANYTKISEDSSTGTDHELCIAKSVTNLLDIIVVSLLVTVQKGLLDAKNSNRRGSGMMGAYSRSVPMARGGV